MIYSKANAEFNKIIKFWSLWPYWQFTAELRVLKTVPVQASMYEWEDTTLGQAAR